MAAVKYGVVYADPPWPYEDGGNPRGGVDKEYPTMSVREICALGAKIQPLLARDCCLFLWKLDTHPDEALAVLRRWGFYLHSDAFVWVKMTNDMSRPRMGAGRWTRKCAETCLLGLRGRPKRLAADVLQVLEAPRGEHSVKPPEIRMAIERLCGDVPRLELFARERVPGWDAWGNEIDSTPHVQEQLQ